MPEARERVEEAAIGWLVRLRDGDADDWERFVLWLETDPLHASVYDEVALADDALAGLPRIAPAPLTSPVERAPPRRMSRRAFAGWGVAAALLATVGYVSLRPDRDVYALGTGPGERRSIALADGSRIDLNGSTRILLDRNDSRSVRLAEGEALFTVVHDPSRPFRVEAGDAMLRDMGTTFNVVRAGDALEVAVAEGAVLFNPDREAVNVSPGTILRQKGREVSTSRVDAEGVGSWRQGRLSYSSAPVAQIAADLSRNTGLPVRASPAAAARQFSGVIVIEPDRERLLRRVSALLDVEARRSGNGWMLTAHGENR